MASSVEISGPFDAQPARILHHLRDIGVRVGIDSRPDFTLRAGGMELPIEVKAYQTVNSSIARHLEQLDQKTDIYLLVVAGEATHEARDLLRRSGVGLVDGLGYAHVEMPGVLIHLEPAPGARTTSAARRRPARLTGKAGVAAQALLLDRQRAWQVQDLANEADISTALAHRVLARLDEEGLTTVTGKGRYRLRRLANPSALLDLWAEEMRDRAVQHQLAYRLARAPRELLDAVGQELQGREVMHAFTGAAVASRLAPYVTSAPVVEVWVDASADLQEVTGLLAAEQVTVGHNLVLQQAGDNTPMAFRARADGNWMVNPFRLYYDLRQDPRRGKEQADRVRAELLSL